MTEKVLLGVPPMGGKTISQYYCPECKTKLARIRKTLFYCPTCRKKVKAMLREENETLKLEIPNNVSDIVDELKSYPKTTGTLKKSFSDDHFVNSLRLISYKNAHSYKNKEFPNPLQKERRKIKWLK